MKKLFVKALRSNDDFNTPEKKSLLQSDEINRANSIASFSFDSTATSSTAPNEKLSWQSIHENSYSKLAEFVKIDQFLNQDRNCTDESKLKSHINELEDRVRLLETEVREKDVYLREIQQENVELKSRLRRKLGKIARIKRQLSEGNVQHKTDCDRFAGEVKKLTAEWDKVRADSERMFQKKIDDLKRANQELHGKLTETLRHNYNLGVKFLRMKSTKDALKLSLERFYADKEALIDMILHDLQENQTDIDMIVANEFDRKMTPYTRKYLEVQQKNNRLTHENIALKIHNKSNAKTLVKRSKSAPIRNTNNCDLCVKFRPETRYADINPCLNIHTIRDSSIKEVSARQRERVEKMTRVLTYERTFNDQTSQTDIFDGDKIDGQLIRINRDLERKKRKVRRKKRVEFNTDAAGENVQTVGNVCESVSSHSCRWDGGDNENTTVSFLDVFDEIARLPLGSGHSSGLKTSSESLVLVSEAVNLMKINAGGSNDGELEEIEFL